MTEHNIDPQELEDREDLDYHLAGSVGYWHAETWRREYVVAEGEHDTARLYGRSHNGASLYSEDDPNVDRFGSIRGALDLATYVAQLAKDLGADVRPLIRSRRVAIVATPWHTEAVHNA